MKRGAGPGVAKCLVHLMDGQIHIRRAHADELVDFFDVPQIATARIGLPFERHLNANELPPTGERGIAGVAVAGPMGDLVIWRFVDGEPNLASETEHAKEYSRIERSRMDNKCHPARGCA